MVRALSSSINKFYTLTIITMRWQCINKDTDKRFKHWLCHSALYKKYKHAEERCKPNYKNSTNYYERGIKFLWNSFDEFYHDMHDSYVRHCNEYWEANTTLDRIDNDWPYCRENCRWATWKVQSNNRRRCIKFEYNWKPYNSLKEFCDEVGLNPHTISTRMNRDWMTLEDAIRTPIKFLPAK